MIKPKKVAIALQGGGSWGAYSWGVLDRLLADPDIEITEICGTSAGALNGSIVSYAVNNAKDYKEGAAQARLDLRKFWETVSDGNHELMSLLSMLQGDNFKFTRRDPVKDPNLPALTWMQHGKSMMDSNPLLRFSGLTATFNRAVEGTAALKLRRLIREFIPSYDVIRDGKRLKLHVNAAELSPQGLKNKIFSGQELSIDAAMASATLKGVFEPVEIDGKKYYDGAYTQNPPVDSLHTQPKSKRNFDDILWVMANPPKGQLTPRHQNSFTTKDLEDCAGLVLHHAYDHLLHNLANEKPSDPKSHVIWFNAPHHYNQTSKQNTESEFLEFLYQEGVKTAEEFLKNHKQSLGRKSTVNIASLTSEGQKRAKNTLWPKP